MGRSLAIDPHREGQAIGQREQLGVATRHGDGLFVEHENADVDDTADLERGAIHALIDDVATDPQGVAEIRDRLSDLRIAVERVVAIDDDCHVDKHFDRIGPRPLDQVAVSLRVDDKLTDVGAECLNADRLGVENGLRDIDVGATEHHDLERFARDPVTVDEQRCVLKNERLGYATGGEHG